MCKKLLSLLFSLILTLTMLGIQTEKVDAKSRKGKTTSSRKSSSAKRSKAKSGKTRISGKKSKSTLSARGKKRTGSRYAHRRQVERKFVRTASAMPSERVVEIQQALIQRGFLQGEPTGTYDEATIDAMSNYQKSRNLRATGYPTAESLRDLGLTKPIAPVSNPTPLKETSPKSEKSEVSQSGK